MGTPIEHVDYLRVIGKARIPTPTLTIQGSVNHLNFFGSDQGEQIPSSPLGFQPGAYREPPLSLLYNVYPLIAPVPPKSNIKKLPKRHLEEIKKLSYVIRKIRLDNLLNLPQKGNLELFQAIQK